MISREDQERLEQLEKLIDELKELAEKGVILIVEGKRDREALLSLGICGDFVLATQLPLLDLSENIARRDREAVLLTDWDRNGNRLAAKIRGYMAAYGKVPNTDIRDKLRNLVQKKIKDIEGLKRFITNLRLESQGIAGLTL